MAVGQYREDGAVVTSGVANGEWIVAAGVHKLVPGQVVRPYEAGPVSRPGPLSPPNDPARDARGDAPGKRDVVRG